MESKLPSMTLVEKLQRELLEWVLLPANNEYRRKLRGTFECYYTVDYSMDDTIGSFGWEPWDKAGWDWHKDFQRSAAERSSFPRKIVARFRATIRATDEHAEIIGWDEINEIVVDYKGSDNNAK